VSVQVRIPRRRHGCQSLVSVACCPVDVPTTGRSLVHSNPTDCGVSECDLDVSGPIAAVVREGGGGLNYKMSLLFVILQPSVKGERLKAGGIILIGEWPEHYVKCLS
jgi:hypothetical protein